MKITAVVVTYNRLPLLKECVEALLNQDYEDMDILLVDNDSIDGTKEYIQEITARYKKRVFSLFYKKI